MKFLFATLAILGSFTATPALAQEYQGCFMINGAGRLIRLDSMCPQAAPVNAAQSQPNQPVQAQSAISTQDDLRPIAYADAYCQAKAAGYSERAAIRLGSEAMHNIGITQAGSVDAYLAEPTVPDSVIREAVETGYVLCPDLQ